MERFQGGLVSKADRLLYHSTLGLREVKERKKKKKRGSPTACGPRATRSRRHPAVPVGGGARLYIYIC